MTELVASSIFVLFVLIALSAFFSGSETALIGSSRVKLNHLAAHGHSGARRALRLLADPSEMLGTILVGNNLMNVMAAALATTLIGPLYATVVITLLLLVFAEITPKTFAAMRPEPFAVRVALPVQVLNFLFKPVVWAIMGLTNLLLWPFTGRRGHHKRRLSRQELLTAIKLGARDGELEPSETRMTAEILGLKDKPVQNIMIPAADVDAISETASFKEILEEFTRSGRTRYPVYRGDRSELLGMLLVKDLLFTRDDLAQNWRQYVRPLMSCRADLEADELLRDMQIRHAHMAAVVGEDGKNVGMVTMEDVLEEIVGEIQDEYDDEGELIKESSPDRFTVRGDAEVDDLCKVLNVDLGERHQHMTLNEWFDHHKPTGLGKMRRVKTESAQVVRRGPNRYEIWIRKNPADPSAARPPL